MYGLSDDTVRDLCSIFRRYKNISKVIIFGSRAKGNYRPGSDIDLALVGDGIDCREIMCILDDIDDTGLLYKVDLLDYASISGNPIGRHIDRVGKIFYEATHCPTLTVPPAVCAENSGA